MKKQIFVIMLFVVVATIAKAQINPYPGYIITNSNDTIHGIIDFRSGEHNAQGCLFRNTSSNEMKYYTPETIYAYRLTENRKFYVARTITIHDTKRTVFLEYLIKGTISLYYYPSEAGDYYFFENEEGRMVEVANHEKEVYVNGVRGIQKSNRYIGTMTWLFDKSDNIKKKLKKININKESLSKITKQYHYETCQVGEECIEFESAPDKYSCTINYEISAGAKIHTLNSKDAGIRWNVNRCSSFSPSIIAGINLSVPRISNLFSFQAEGEASKFEGEKNCFLPDYHLDKLNISAFVTDLRVGGKYRLPNLPLNPHVEAGICGTLLWGMDVTYTRSYVPFPYEKIKSSHQDVTEFFQDLYLGLYAGTGFLIPLKKNGISVKISYAQRWFDKDYLSTWGCSLGYVF